MTERLNPITPQFIPVAWAAFCAFGLAVGVQKLFEFPYLSTGWQGGIGLVVLALFALVSIEGWWFASQREIEVGPEIVQLKSWLQVLLGRDGVMISWQEIQSAALVFDGGKKLQLRTAQKAFTFWAAVWDPAVVRRFLEILRERGIPVRSEWGVV